MGGRWVGCLADRSAGLASTLKFVCGSFYRCMPRVYQSRVRALSLLPLFQMHAHITRKHVKLKSISAPCPLQLFLSAHFALLLLSHSTMPNCSLFCRCCSHSLIRNALFRPSSSFVATHSTVVFPHAHIHTMSPREHTQFISYRCRCKKERRRTGGGRGKRRVL